MPRRILVVEDNALNRRLFAHVLDMAGFRVVEAADGTAGLAAVEQERPDLVLLDLDLPGLSGFEILSRIRADGSFDGMPVLAVSAIVTQSTEARVLALGCAAYLPKPVRPSELLAAIDAALNSSTEVTRAAGGRWAASDGGAIRLQEG
ncbi:MAG: response regulator [Pikeienuella sp.]